MRPLWKTSSNQPCGQVRNDSGSRMANRADWSERGGRKTSNPSSAVWGLNQAEALRKWNQNRGDPHGRGRTRRRGWWGTRRMEKASDLVTGA